MSTDHDYSHVHDEYAEKLQQLVEAYQQALREAYGVRGDGAVYLVPDWFLAIGVRLVTASPVGQYMCTFLSSDSPSYTLRGLVDASMEHYLDEQEMS